MNTNGAILVEDVKSKFKVERSKLTKKIIIIKNKVSAIVVL